MAGSLEGRKALITGASSGIGEATALAMVAEGAAVALGARRKDRLDELAARIEADGGRAVAIEADVSDERVGRGAGRDRERRDSAGSTASSTTPGVMLLGPAAGSRPEGVAADDRRQPARAPLLHPLRAAAACATAGEGT